MDLQNQDWSHVAKSMGLEGAILELAPEAFLRLFMPLAMLSSVLRGDFIEPSHILKLRFCCGDLHPMLESLAENREVLVAG